jgi:Protein of unknown function (DUF3800)
MYARGLNSGRKVLNVYIDESSQDAHRYMLHGGISVPDSALPDVHRAIEAVRQQHNTFGTLKWGKVSKAKLPIYIDLCDLFFELSAADILRFHSLTIDTSKVDNARFNFGNREVGFSKMVYQLLIKFARMNAKDFILHCYLDHRTTKQSLDELQAMVNNGLAKRWNISNRPVRRVQFVQTEDTPLLQLNDVLLGALASRCNDHHLKRDAAPHKVTLSAHVLARANIRYPLRSTPYGEERFTTWNFALR